VLHFNLDSTQQYNRRAQMKSLRHLLTAVGLAWILTMLPHDASAALGCPFTRPSGLSLAQVDSVVLKVAEKYLHRQTRPLDITRTIEQLDGTFAAEVIYNNIAIDISQAFGFSAFDAFDRATKARGKTHAFSSLALADIQSISRSMYSQGSDAPPPLAKDIEYSLFNLTVRSPLTDGWTLLACKWDYIEFERRSDNGTVHRADARSTTVPRLEEKGSPLEYARYMAQIRPPGFAVVQTTAEPTGGQATSCADFSNVSKKNDLTHRLFGRFCYVDATSSEGYIARFTVTGSTVPISAQQDAVTFIKGVRPR
jgi:hypothetical protein